MSWASIENRYHDDKVYDACGLFGFIDTTGLRQGGERIIAAVTNMREGGMASARALPPTGFTLTLPNITPSM